jgi:mono/diheme cytochrome c family protein
MVEMIETKLPAELDLLASLEKERDPRVAEQLAFTLGTIDDPKAEKIIQPLASNHLTDKGVMLATTISLWGKKHLPLVHEIQSTKAFAKLPQAKKASVNMEWNKALSSWDRGMKFAKDFDSSHRKMIQNGEKLYFQHCTSCHGADGKGVQIPGTELYLAPSLVDSQRVHGDPEQLMPLFFHGLIGPIEGKPTRPDTWHPPRPLASSVKTAWPNCSLTSAMPGDEKMDPLTSPRYQESKRNMRNAWLPGPRLN